MSEKIKGRGVSVVISRVWAMPNKATFTIPPVAALLKKYGVGPGWADPFAGFSEVAEHRNDADPDRAQPSQLDAIEFCKQLPDGLAGVLVDPPYSPTQMKEHYDRRGETRSWEHYQNLYSRVSRAVTRKVSPGGHAISFGWQSNGLGSAFGPIVEILIVNHGGAHYDTLVTVQRRSMQVELRV